MPQDSQGPRSEHFICLDPHKTKHDRVEKTLSAVGRLQWFKIPPMRLRGWPETTERAEQALASAKSGSKPSIMNVLKKRLLMWQYNGARAVFLKNPNAVAVAWNGLNSTRRVFMDGAHDAGARTLFFELAPLPGRITVDPCGVNYANSLPRLPAPYLEWFNAHKPDPDKWREAGMKIQQRRSENAAVVPANDAIPPLSAPFLFVPLQVPGDSQLRLFGGRYRTVSDFITALVDCAAKLPEGWHLRIKEHPSAEHSYAEQIQNLEGVPVYLDNGTDTFEQVAASHAVITVNSSVGLESMYYDKPVVAAGQCFWAIKGVATSAQSLESLAEIFSDPASLAFDPQVRRAFLSFLNEIYYPDVSGNDLQDHKIKARLAGEDQFGFWKCQRGVAVL